MPYPRGEKFADEAEHDDFDQETGMPTLSNAASAIQVWSMFQERPKVSVKECADAFNLDYAQVREAVTAHYWMYLEGPDDDPANQFIEHDGE